MAVDPLSIKIKHIRIGGIGQRKKTKRSLGRNDKDIL